MKVPRSRFSEQPRLAAAVSALFGRGKDFADAVLICAEHCSYPLLRVSASVEKSGGIGLVLAEAGPLDLDIVQQNTRDRVTKSSHAIPPQVVAAVALPSVGVGQLHSQGDSLLRIALHLKSYFPICSGFNRIMSACCGEERLTRNLLMNRRPRAGWTVWGNQTEKFPEVV